jgi:hypothetical protein
VRQGRPTRVWYEQGMRPPAVVDQPYKSLSLFAATRPGTDEAFALALPRADAGTMDLFLDPFSRQLAPDGHAVLLLDQAGWHDGPALRVPCKRTASAAAVRLARPEPGGADLAVLAGVVSLASRAGRRRGCPDCNLPGLEQAPRPDRPPQNPHLLPIPYRVRTFLNGY